MKLSYNTKLVFQGADKQMLVKTLEAQRFAWNECSKARFTLTQNSIVDLHKLFYVSFRKCQPQIPAQIVINTQRSVLSAFKTVKSNKHRTKSAPVKKHLSMQLDKNSFSYKNGTFSIISLGKRIKCQPYLYPRLEKMLAKYKFCDPSLFERDGEVWIRLTFTVPETLSPKTLALGVDLGCRVFAATSEGNLFIDKGFNSRKRRLRHLKDKLRSKSESSKSARRHLKKLRRKERNANQNFTHHLANKILDTKADVIVLENLKSLKVKKNRFQTRNRLSQISFHALKQVLTYKAPLLGKTVIEVCPSYTSQIDHRTERRNGTRKGRRYYSESGIIYDADVNGAINIAIRSKLPVSQTKNLTYGQAIVNSPIVGAHRSQAPSL